MTKEEIENLKLGISPIDDRAVILINSAVEWLGNNTSVDITKPQDFTASVKLFLIKFFDLYTLNDTVASESISGLSLSYKSVDIEALLWGCAEELLPTYLKSRIRFICAENRWN